MVDKKLLAAWAHFPVVLGILVPIYVWFTNKDTDKNMAFQAKQALVWQFLWMFVLLGIMLIGGILVIATFGTGIDGILFLLMPLVSLLLFAVGAIFAVLGAIKTYQGKDFTYPVIGNMLK